MEFVCTLLCPQFHVYGYSMQYILLHLIVGRLILNMINLQNMFLLYATNLNLNKIFTQYFPE